MAPGAPAGARTPFVDEVFTQRDRFGGGEGRRRRRSDSGHARADVPGHLAIVIRPVVVGPPEWRGQHGPSMFGRRNQQPERTTGIEEHVNRFRLVNCSRGVDAREALRE